MYHHDNTRPVPMWVCKLLYMQNNKVEEQKESQNQENRLTKSNMKLRDLEEPIQSEGPDRVDLSNDKMDALLKVLNKLQKQLEGNENNSDTEYSDWQKAALKLDYLLFWVFAFLMLFTTFVCFIQFVNA